MTSEPRVQKLQTSHYSLTYIVYIVQFTLHHGQKDIDYGISDSKNGPKDKERCILTPGFDSFVIHTLKETCYRPLPV